MKWKIIDEASNIQPLEIPKLPRFISGLRNDGKPDKRFTRGETMQEMSSFMERASGYNKDFGKKGRGPTA